ncbi:UPF0606 protein KIAA1549 isoform X2 [Acanthopagrus latus]|uniref:UPF0606 protein KIAA1549 isoform X2 n=1 Tax=Acanthopagrus latus TaxID=8177 RepID=UPI00187C035A|nr:UPF0606 protein KIAA1549 isoform X2 [Acanthopagrus latus]
MAPGLRSGRRIGHPKVVVGAGEPGGCPPRRTDAGGEGRCSRTRWRAGAAGMLPNCLLSAGMLLLLVRCALAAEEKPTYDASGSSSLQSDPTVTAAPAHPLADLSVAEEVPFSVVHPDGDSESEGEGLSGQPAFSSVLTVMAGTVKHPVSLDQSRTLPTITRDVTHTTQWPSHSSSQGSEMSSSSSSSAGDRILPASSGLTSTTSEPSHVSFLDGNRNVSLFPTLTISSSSLSSSSVSTSAPSTSSLLSPLVSLLSLPPSAGWTTKAASPPQSQRIASSPVPQTETVTLSPAGSRGRPDSLTSTRSAVTAVTPGLKSTTTDFSSETSIEKGSEVTKHSFYTPADKIHGVSGIYIRSASTKAIKTPATSTHASYSPPSHLLDILHGPTGTWNIGMDSKLANNLEISTSSPTNQESQAVQRQQGALQNPTSALLSAPPKIYSLSSHVTQQMLSQTAYVDSQTFVHKSARDAIMSPLNSNVVNPTISPAMTLRPGGSFFTVSSQTPPGKMSLSESAISELTPIRSGTASSEHASNPGDLLMAAGHGSPRVPAININYNQGEIAEAELKTISAQAHLNNSLSLLQPRPESTAGSISRTGTITSSTSESDSLRLPSNGVIKVKEILTQAGSPEVVAQEPTGWLTAKMIFPSNSRTASHSGSVLPVGLTKHITHETTRPTYLSPLSLSANHKNTHHDMDLSASSEVNFSDQAKASLSMQTTSSKSPFQTQSLLTYPQNVYTASHQTGSSTKISAHIIKSDRAGYSTPSTIEVGTVAGSSKTSPASDFPVTHGKSPAESFHGNTAKTSVSPLFDQLTLISDTAFNKKGVPSVQFTTQFPSFMATEGFFVVTKGSSEGSPTENPFSPLPFDAASESLKGLSRKDAATLVGESPPSSWLDIILTPRTNSASHSQGSITSARGHKSNFYSGRRTAIPSTASSAATMSSSDGRNSSETIRAIFSFGTKIMAPYTKWKTTKPPVPFQSAASELENTSTAFDRAKSNLQADGPSHEHPKLEGGQERNVHRLNLTDPTAVASDPYSDGEHPSFQYVKGTSGYKEQSVNLFPAHLRSAPAQRGATVNTAAPSGSDGFLPLSHITTASVPASQASSLAFLYESGHSPPLADVDSLDSAFDAALTNNPPLDFSETINKTNDWKLSELTLPTELVPPSSSGSSSLSHSGIKASLHVEPFISVSSSLLSSLTSHPGTVLFIKPSMHPGTASPSMSVPVTSPSPSPSPTLTETFVAPTETGMDELAAGTSRVDALTLPKEKVVSLAPSQSVRITLSAGPTERTSQVSPLPPRQDTTTASITLTTTTVATNTRTKSPTTTTPSFRVTTGTMQSTTTTTTPQPPTVTRRTTTTTTIRTQTSRRTFTPPVPRTSPPRGATAVFLSPFTTTTEAPPQQCNITERLWVKTVVSIYVRRNRLDSIQRQNLRRGLSQGLRKALNDSSAQAQVETVFGSPNMTVAYHVTGGDIVYPPSVVQEGLDSYGRDKLIADLRQYLPMVTALPLPVALWRSSPATGFQLKTVLQFVGAGDDPRSCRFSQMMEQRLEKVFSEAQAKVLNTNSRLSVQMLSVSQAAASPAVSLVYTVRNGTVFLNGTTASNLLGQLSAELVGYFLFYPPLIIAEPMEYHNLNTSVATRDFWVITVIQDVDNASLEGQYQSFASLMEQRLAELFVLAGQQGTRFRRATAVGSFTVQMVSIRRVSGSKNPAEMTYYVQHNGIPLSGTSAAKVLNTVDSQTMALTLGYFVQLQAEPVVKNPPNNLWIIAAVLAPIAVVTLIIIIITAVLCRKNKNDFKADAIGNLNPRAKMAYRRDVGYYHQPVQGFDYAKQHLGQQGGDEETLPASQDTLVMSLQIRDTPHSLEKALQQDGTANKRSLTSDKHKSKLPSEDGSVISNESEKPNSGRGLTVLKVTAQQKLTKEETRKRDDPYDTSSGSLQLISIKPVVAQPNYSHPASSDRSQDSAIVNGEVNLALKQKSDIEHYRNKLRLKAKRKGYYDFPSTDGSSSGRAVAQRQRHGHERAAGEHGRPLEPDDERGSTYVKSHRRHSQVGQTAYRSRQSLSSPSPGGTEMDLLVMRERPRRGIRNSGYDTEPELIEETNVDRLMGPRGYMYGRGLKGHSETSTLSSQPSIDEVRQQMHLLLEEAFSLASGGQSTSGRHSHHHHHPPPDHYSHAPPPLPYADVVTSAPGTMSCGRGGLQWVPSYGAEVYQCSLPKPAFHFTQLPEMAVGSPPPLPPRTGPPPGTSLRRSTSDLGPKGRSSETSVTEMQSQHDNNPYGPTTRAALPSITAEQPVSNYSGNPITAVYAIPATRPGYSEYFVSTPPTSYHSPSWMSYPPEPEDVPPQWADSLPLPGYVEAFPHPRYPQGSPTRLPLQYNPALEQPPTAPSTASQQSLPQVVKDMDSMPLSSLSTSALVQAIRQEVAKLAKKQNDVFEF